MFIYFNGLLFYYNGFFKFIYFIIVYYLKYILLINISFRCLFKKKKKKKKTKINKIWN